MPARKGKQESLLMGKKGLSGASQSKSISVFSLLYIVGLSRLEQSGMPGGVAGLGQLCPCPSDVSSPCGSSGSAGCCVQVTDISLSSMHYLRVGESANSDPNAPSGMLSSCCQLSHNENWSLLHPLFIQTLHYFTGLLLLTRGWESTLFLLVTIDSSSPTF